MATEVNQVWNYCNELSDRMIRERGRWMSGFDFSAYTVGASKQFEHIGSSTIQETAEHYASKRFSAKRRKLGQLQDNARLQEPAGRYCLSRNQ
ncbi:hypothetical protein IMCC3135_23315 [Granulosicoccus antarcticus IMCC3135]|uniref:Uncharacterized protein n=2 Tax=Granulosicoccus TaxID=437504 RepID=A0A2Z2NT53_9GAMM|nr:hypothetical protein IMCC3135_23315 [Granulosicoccus antarcticus IMCC3135]